MLRGHEGCFGINVDHPIRFIIDNFMKCAPCMASRKTQTHSQRLVHKGLIASAIMQACHVC